jgi:hypothetical protein
MNSKFNLNKIPQYTQWPTQGWDVEWKDIEMHIEIANKDHVNLDPDFQRGYVWTEAQQASYVEYILRGGCIGRDLLFNCPGWNSCLTNIGPYELVDGKQRLEAVRKFMRNDLFVFCDGTVLGNKTPLSRTDFAGHFRFYHSFRWNVNDLPTRSDVLKWYLDLNSGGTVHTKEDLEKVRALLKKEQG